MSKFKLFISEYMTMILFILGAIFLNTGIYCFDWIGGLCTTGITFIIFAVIRNNEENNGSIETGRLITKSEFERSIPMENERS
ncbi:hypothetical protein [Lactobacillus sp. ESL0677]|uniref:hypothetical protein n=1 Tax=Lactobacillus sp. ESL0677 TaxID=2983208 RepID=UPI0023F93449|nr:hypothetical protein [Lactobacillus sp. ESL0677]WEV36223.1 hypothetical protein OZX76_05605 [Lactobacillus sp. ESL0677]